MKVEFTQPLRARMRQALAKARRREIGGILMAEQVEAGHFRLADFTIDEVTGSAAHFVRSVEHHHRALDRFTRKPRRISCGSTISANGIRTQTIYPFRAPPTSHRCKILSRGSAIFPSPCC
ncbi:hypothetical protein [Sphingobium scionense]